MSKPAPAAAGYHPWVTFLYGRREARYRGDRRVGTEHVLLGLLREPVIAAALGSDVPAARAALDRLDRDAIAAVIGAGLEAPPSPLHAPDGPVPRPTVRAVLRERMPMTPAAKKALEATREDARRQGWDPRKVLLALLEREPPDPGAQLLTALGVDRQAARTRLVAVSSPATA